ncbi:MAG: response regulator [Anaerolineae bacterium]|nr:response regulator [Anaerolineae bacterium]
MYTDDSHKHAGVVLCIDPDRGNLHAMERNLSHMGYIVFTETSTRRGLQIALQQQPDVILLDVQHSDLPQADLQDIFNRHPHLGNAAMIALASDWEAEESSHCCAEIGCKVHLPKPVGRSSLLKAVQQLAIGRSQAGV